MSWIAPDAGPLGFEQVFGLRPELFGAWRAFHDLFFERQLLDRTLLELCRLRIAQRHGCAAAESEWRAEAEATDVARAKLDALADWRDSTAFTPTERAALDFAEKFAIDVHEISDADARAVAGALGDAGMVAFAEALALFDGFVRFRLALGIGENGPARDPAA